MSQTSLLAGSAIFACGLIFIIAAVLMQEVRSRLVALLIEQKSPLSLALSDWTVSGGRIPGNYDAIKREFIWGSQSLELAAHPGAAPMVRAAKVLDVVREAGRVFGLASLVWFLWVGIAGAQ